MKENREPCRWEAENEFPYEDIVSLPRPVFDGRPRMPLADRAAQFAPFAALAGYGEAVKEAARFTDRRMELSEDQKERLNRCLGRMIAELPEAPEAVFTYFRPDSRKDGGAYVTATGRLGKWDGLQRMIWLTDGTKIPIDDIGDIECGPEIF
ncbi:MAG: YolD-like family protein [Lachnospiraceae bacterium]|nr:YolD-like family protein [Lachnospiraceae bacterium]